MRDYPEKVALGSAAVSAALTLTSFALWPHMPLWFYVIVFIFWLFTIGMGATLAIVARKVIER